MALIYDINHEGNIVEITNWKDSDRDRDAIITRELGPSETKLYEEMHEAGHTDSEIWLALHPNWPRYIKRAPTAPAFTLSINSLTKEQLVEVIERRFSSAFPSMTAMDLEDLQRLVTALVGGDEIAICWE